MRVYSFGARDGFPDQLEGPAFLYEDKSKQELWLIDVPTHTNLMLRETDLSPMDLTAILVTHLHNDHVGGLIDLIQLRMICLANQDIMRQAGYFDKIATNILPIYLFGYDEEWWQAIEQVIDKNCPDNWGDWRDYHKIVPVHKNLKKGSILIDFGFSRVRESDGLIRITGDFEFSSCSKKANLITPVPGGMGPITVACLFENILEFEK